MNLHNLTNRLRLGMFFVVIASSGCSAPVEADEPTGHNSEAITGSVQAAWSDRVIAAYAAADIRDFHPTLAVLEPDEIFIAASNVSVITPRWFRWEVDGRLLAVLDFNSDDVSVLFGGDPRRGNVILIFEIIPVEDTPVGSIALFLAHEPASGTWGSTR